MKRVIIIILIIFWAVIALAAVAFIASSVSGNKFGSAFNVSFGVSNAELLREETFTAGMSDSLEIDVSSDDVEMVLTDSASFTVRQYGPKNKPESSLFKVESSGGRVRIYTGYTTNVVFFGFWGGEKIIVEVPRSWLGAASVHASSGTVRLRDSFSFKDALLETSSGSIKIESPLSAGNFTLKSSSGSVRVYRELDLTGKLDASSSSGSQNFEGLIKARDASISTTSGSINVRAQVLCQENLKMSASSGSVNADRAEIEAQSLTVNTTSGTVRLAEVKAERYDLSASSGKITAQGMSGEGTVKTSSGGIDITLLDLSGDLNLSSSSGGIRLSVPRELSFGFEANTSSGSIRADFELFYSSERKNNASAEVGTAPRARITARATSGSIRVYTV